MPRARVDAIRRSFLQDVRVLRADYDTARKCAYVPNDPLWNQQWDMRAIKTDTAWDLSLGSSAATVAIMDTGVMLNHPDLAANIWVNTGEIPGNGIDDDGNGYVDDVNGYDFAYNDPNPDDQYGHGTACAGLAAAVGDNAIGLSGVAPRAKIAAIKAARDDGYFYDSANVPAFLYCADMHIDVISMSFFSDQVTPAERDAVDYAWAHNVTLVAASGNSNSAFPYYPAAYDNVISVAATDGSNNKSWFSDFGTWVSVAAPGEGLTTTTNDGGYTGGFAGTSGACPHVAGLAALLKGANPSATNAQIRAAIEDGATTLIQNPYGQYTRYGLVNSQDSMQRVLGMRSGSKPAVLQFVEPVGGPQKLFFAPANSTGVLAGGLGFEKPNVCAATYNGKPIGISNQTRRSFTASVATDQTGTLAFSVNGQNIGAITFEKAIDTIYAPTDASTNGDGTPVLSGGFFQLYRADGSSLTCTARSGPEIYVELPIRKIKQKTFSRLEIEITRSYANSAGGTETVYLYDWSAWSYPYGPFNPIGTASITGSGTFTSNYVISSNPTRYLDPEGTIYAIVDATGVHNNSTISIDAFRVKIR